MTLQDQVLAALLPFGRAGATIEDVAATLPHYSVDTVGRMVRLLASRGTFVKRVGSVTGARGRPLGVYAVTPEATGPQSLPAASVWQFAQRGTWRGRIPDAHPWHPRRIICPLADE